MAFTLDQTVAGWFIAFVFIGVAYYAYLQNKNHALKTTLPQGRARPIVMTEVGLRVIRETIPLDPNKYQVVYEGADQYRATYTRVGDFDELVPIYKHQIMVGGSAPVYIEYKVLLEAAYSYEDAPTRKLLKKTLAELSNKLSKRGLSDKQAAEVLTKLHATVKNLSEQPVVYSEMVSKLATQTDKAFKAQSDAAALSGGIEGAIARRTEPFVQIATSKASRPDDRKNSER